MKIFRSACRFALLSIVGLNSSWAQLTTGRITGAITDSSGAAISKATVTITNENTAAQRVLETAGDGSYIVDSLPPAAYDVKVSKTGFAASELTNLVIGVGQTVTHDFAIKVSGNETLVTVEAGAMVGLDTSSAKIGATVANREIANDIQQGYCK